MVFDVKAHNERVKELMKDKQLVKEAEELAVFILDRTELHILNTKRKDDELFNH